MQIFIPNISDPFWVYGPVDSQFASREYLYQMNSRVHDRINISGFTTFVLIDPNQEYDLRREFLHSDYDSVCIPTNIHWVNWLKNNFEGRVERFEVSLMRLKSFGGFLFGFENAEDAVVFKLKWII